MVNGWSLRQNVSHPSSEEGETGYLESIGDLMAGLLFVFILMTTVFAIQFQNKTDDLTRMVARHNEAVAQLTQTENIRRALLEQVARSLHQRGVAIQVDLEQGVLRLPESILFASGSADLTPQGQQAVRILAQELERVLPCYSQNAPAGCSPALKATVEAVFVEGHTDNVPIRNAPFPDNWSLSAARAIRTYQALVAASPQLATLKNADGVPLFGVSGYADHRPVASNDTEQGRRQNRRIDLRFIMMTPHANEAAQKLQQLQQEGASSHGDAAR